MAAPVLLLHQDEAALGAALIRAAADAAGCGGGLVAAWAFCHLVPPVLSVELAAAEILTKVAAGGGPCSGFSFQSEPRGRTPGLIPPPIIAFDGAEPIAFDPALAALADAVDAGAFGLVVSNGLSLDLAPGPKVAYRPGILRLHPRPWGQTSTGDADVFAGAGFPTLVISPEGLSGPRSAHEVLELFAQLTGYMARDRRAAA